MVIFLKYFFSSVASAGIKTVHFHIALHHLSSSTWLSQAFEAGGIGSNMDYYSILL